MYLYFLLAATVIAQKTLDLPLLNLRNIYYSATMLVGSNQKPLSFIIDTGSSTLWVAGQNCSDCSYQGMYHSYDCAADKSCKPSGERMDVQYGIGEVEGEVITTSITVDGQEARVESILIDSIKELPDFVASGLIGLGKPVDHMDTLPERLFDSGHLGKPEFSLYLTAKGCGTQSVLTLGGSNSSFYKGELQQVSSPDNEYWSVALQKARVAKDVFPLTAKQLLIDSGTTKITLPEKDMEVLVKLIKEKHSISCHIITGSQSLKGMECDYQSDISEFPIIEFELLSTTDSAFSLKLTPSLYLDKCYISIWAMGLRCLTNFQVLEENMIVLGVSFMQHYYTNFDFKNRTIGFAQVAQDVQVQIIFEQQYTSKDLLYKSVEGYEITFRLLLLTVSVLNVFYCIGKAFIYSKMDLYASVLEKSSTRSDQELSNLKPKQTLTQLSMPSSPDSHGKEQFKEIPHEDPQN